MQSPFHEGELKVQRITGESHVAASNGAMIADKLMRGAWPFLAQQSFAIFGSSDDEGRVWASMLFGIPGFMTSNNGLSVRFDLSLVALQLEDPFWRNIEGNSTVGMIAIELATRRRVRINGAIVRSELTTLKLDVKEAFPNCPKYITRRVLKTVVTGNPEKARAIAVRSLLQSKSSFSNEAIRYLSPARIQRAVLTHRTGAVIQASLKCWTREPCAFPITLGTACSIRSAIY
jgi:uncharacterized protein